MNYLRGFIVSCFIALMIPSVVQAKDIDFIYVESVNLTENEQNIVFEIANNYSISYTLILSIIEYESSCDPQVISKSGDYGLMQINEVNHDWLKRDLGLDNLLDSRQNVEAGCFILSELIDKGYEPTEVLTAYNMGEDGLKRLQRKGIYTSKYADEILQRELEISQEIDKERI